MRCTKCGYVTFDREGKCPKCGKKLPPPLAHFHPRKPRRHKSGLTLSPLNLAPVPKFYGASRDAEMIPFIQLGEPPPLPEIPAPPPPEIPGERAAGSAEAVLDAAEEMGGAATLDMDPPGESAPPPDAIADDFELESLLGEETPPETEFPVEEATETPAEISEADALLDELEFAEAEEAGAAAPADEAETAVPAEGDLAALLDDAADAPPAGDDLDTLLDEGIGEAAPAAETPALEAPVADDDLSALLDAAAGEAEIPAPEAAEGPAPGEAVADDDLAALLDEAESPAGEEAPADDDLAALLDDAAGEPAAAEAPPGDAPAAAESPSGDDADLDDLWADAMAEQQAGEAAQAVEAETPAPAETSADDSGEESIDDLWGEAFAEQEATQKQAASGDPADAAAVSAEGGGEDLSGMWDEAFAEQEAAETAVREGVAPDAGAGDAAATDDDLDQLLAGAGEDVPAAEGSVEVSAEEGAGEASAEAPAEGDEGLLSQGDLDDLISGFSPSAGEADEGEAAAPAAEAEPAENVSADLEDLMGEDAPAAAPADDDDDDEEIEAFISSDEPAPVDDEEAEAEELPEPVAAMAEVEADDGAAPAAISKMPRLLAALVDVGVVGLLELIFAGGTHFIVAQAAGSIFSNMEALLLVLALDLMVLFLLSLLYSVYFIGLRGETVGQALIGLRVVDLDDHPVGYMQAVLRYFGGLAATVPLGLGHILLFLDKKGRSLGDRLAGTKVVASAAA